MDFGLSIIPLGMRFKLPPIEEGDNVDSISNGEKREW
jgi:hypothetical protein